MRIVKIILKVNFFESNPFSQNSQNSENGRHPQILREAFFLEKDGLFLENTYILKILKLYEQNRHYQRRLFGRRGWNHFRFEMTSYDNL